MDAIFGGGGGGIRDLVRDVRGEGDGTPGVESSVVDEGEFLGGDGGGRGGSRSRPVNYRSQIHREKARIIQASDLAPWTVVQGSESWGSRISRPSGWSGDIGGSFGAKQRDLGDGAGESRGEQQACAGRKHRSN